VPVHHDGGIRFLLAKDAVECMTRLCQCGIGESGLVVDRRETGGEQQIVAFAQGDVERLRQREHHVATWPGPSDLDEAEMPR